MLCVVAFVFAPLLVPLLAPGLGKDIGQHDQLTAEAADRATRGGYIPPPGYGLPTAMPWPNKASDADPDREDPQ